MLGGMLSRPAGTVCFVLKIMGRESMAHRHMLRYTVASSS